MACILLWSSAVRVHDLHMDGQPQRVDIAAHAGTAAEKTGKVSLLNHPSCPPPPPTTQSVKGLN